jgi:hypothetical protein
MNLTSCGDANGCVERVIARLRFEDYLLGLGEVPASWPMEAMRAQAVAARTYAAYALKHYGRRAECNCDISDGASDQTYIGYTREGATTAIDGLAASPTRRDQTYHGNVIRVLRRVRRRSFRQRRGRGMEIRLDASVAQGCDPASRLGNQGPIDQSSRRQASARLSKS